MNLIIHRGTKEIGGSCVELKTGKTRILIDFGMPLVDAQKERFDAKQLIGKSIENLKKIKVLPDIQGLYKGEQKSIDAILVSHSHPDHYGLLNYVHPDIPIYLSEGAKQLVEISNIFTLSKVGSLTAKIIKNKRALKIGEFAITPYLVDHSAFDALAFLIEAEGKGVFYSGDFRGHGRKSALFKRIIASPPGAIDCLIMEGSIIGRDELIYQNEGEVQSRIENILKSAENICFLFVSSQNIDRLVSAYKACIRTEHIFVIDIYTAYILDKLRKISKNIPQFNWRNIRVKFLKNQADKLAKEVSTKLLYHYNTRKIDIFEINRKKNKILMLARDNSIFPALVKSIKGTEGARIIYSMWEGYLTEEFKEFCNKKGLQIDMVHTSGHAQLEDLKSFASALNPKKLIPIHTFERDRYTKLFRNVQVLEDGEALDL